MLKVQEFEKETSERVRTYCGGFFNTSSDNRITALTKRDNHMLLNDMNY